MLGPLGVEDDLGVLGGVPGCLAELELRCRSS